MAGPRQVQLNGNNNGVKAPPAAPALSASSNGSLNDSHNYLGESRGSEGGWKILSSRQLENLRTHKYSSTSNSLLDPIFQPYWNFVVNLLPLSIAPNVLTITGLILNIVTSLLVFYFAPDLTPESPVPRWVCLTYALAIFAYQTLDAIDGKQARRTGTSSPLGELFDHGCDSLSTVYLTLGVAAVAGTGASVLTLFHCALGSFLFYCVHWRTYMTGSLYFGKMDVTEAELAIIGVHLATWVFGSEMWGWTVLGVVDARTLVILAAVPMEFWSLGQTFGIMVDKWRKDEKTLAGTSVLAPAVAIAAVYLPMIYVAVFSNDRVYENCPVLFILSFGFVACKVTDGLIVAHMTRSGVKLWDWSLVGPIVMCCNVMIGSVVNERALLWCMLVGSGVDLCVYCDKVCREICDGLKISLFKIKSV